MNEHNPVILRERKLKFPSLTTGYSESVNKTTSVVETTAQSAPKPLWNQQQFWFLWRSTTTRILRELAQFIMVLFLWQVEENDTSHKQEDEVIPAATTDLFHDNLGSSTPNALFTSIAPNDNHNGNSNGNSNGIHNDHHNYNHKDSNNDNDLELSSSGADELLIVVEERITNDPDVSIDLFSKLLRQYTGDNVNKIDGPKLFEEAQYGTVLGKQGLGSLETGLPLVNVDDNRHLISESNGSSDDRSLLDLGNFTDYNKVVAKFYIPRVPRTQYSLVDSLLGSLNISKPVDHTREQIRIERESLILTIRTLTDDQQAKVNKIWRALNQQMIVSSAFQIDISVRDMQTLCDGQWLNDNVIDFYLNLISLDLKVYCWTTHFFLTLELKGYQGVARWAKRRKLKVLEQRKILTPINIMGTHWALAVIDSDKKAFEYYDSLLSSGNKRALKILQNYMIEEGKKQGCNEDYTQYKIVPLMDTPQQLNGYDCGVFTCTLAFFVARNQPLKFGQQDMKTIRRKMAYEILSKEFLA